MLKRVLSLVLVMSMMFTTVAYAAEGQDKGNDYSKTVLKQLFIGDENQIGSFFSQRFLESISAKQMKEVIQWYKQKLGNICEVTKQNEKYLMTFEKGYFTCKLTLDKDNKIIGLSLSSCKLNTDTLESILGELDTLKTNYSICIKKNNKELLVGINHKEKMAVASAFKLFVLKGLYDAVDEGKANWDDIILLDNRDKSLGSGILHKWPEKTPVTVKTLSNLMISISDNTATDHLIEYLGRKKIEKFMDKKDFPFLKTNETFRLIYAKDSKVLEQYLEASLYGKRIILQGLKDKITSSNLQLSDTPSNINNVGWLFSTESLCDVIYDLKDSQEAKINPGLISKDEWADFAFKGGSMPGVFNCTQLIQKEKDGDIYTISMTLNDTDNVINENKARVLFTRLIQLINTNKLVEEQL